VSENNPLKGPGKAKVSPPVDEKIVVNDPGSIPPGLKGGSINHQGVEDDG
jgi:hypothetical protein